LGLGPICLLSRLFAERDQGFSRAQKEALTGKRRVPDHFPHEGVVTRPSHVQRWWWPEVVVRIAAGIAVCIGCSNCCSQGLHPPSIDPPADGSDAACSRPAPAGCVRSEPHGDRARSGSVGDGEGGVIRENSLAMSRNNSLAPCRFLVAGSSPLPPERVRERIMKLSNGL
jgi:hypothetical protein